MFKPIQEIKQHYTYAVQPVKLFETKNSQTAQKSSFDFINQMNKSGHNPFHPNITNTEKGNRLDIIS